MLSVHCATSDRSLFLHHWWIAADLQMHLASGRLLRPASLHVWITFLLHCAHNYIYFPKGEDALHDTKIGFHAIALIPGILGASDGILKPI